MSEFIQPIPPRDTLAYALTAQIHNLNIAAMREIQGFLDSRDYRGAHAREDMWREDILEACCKANRHNHDVLAATRRQLVELLELLPHVPILPVESGLSTQDKPIPFKRGDRVKHRDCQDSDYILTVEKVVGDRVGWKVFFKEGGSWYSSQIVMAVPLPPAQSEGHVPDVGGPQVRGNTFVRVNGLSIDGEGIL